MQILYKNEKTTSKHKSFKFRCHKYTPLVQKKILRQNISLFVYIIHDISLGNCFACMKDNMAFWRTQK